MFGVARGIPPSLPSEGRTPLPGSPASPGPKAHIDIQRLGRGALS